MMIIKPLLISTRIDHYAHQFHCIGLFDHAINLQNNDGDLITIHRYNRGLSPFGCLLKSDDFDDVKAYVEINDSLFLSQTDMQHKNFVINRHARKISCQLPFHPSKNTTLSATDLSHFLSKYSQETGLYGPLNKIISTPLSGELLLLQQNFLRWLKGELIDWHPHIGKGQGLTPSNDDTLIGMIFAAFFDDRVRKRHLASTMQDLPFFPADTLKALPKLTTYVSVAYYRAALHGEFSLPFLHFCNALLYRNTSSIEHTLGNISQLGHTSGIDTLLGIWLAANALDLYGNKP